MYYIIVVALTRSLVLEALLPALRLPPRSLRVSSTLNAISQLVSGGNPTRMSIASALEALKFVELGI